MAKMRIHELAKELDIKSTDIIEELGKKGIEAKAQSSIDDENIEFIKNKFSSAKKVNNASKEDGEAKPEEKAKPRVLITSKGIVKTGERRHGDGEKRRRRRSGDGEHRHRSKHSSETKGEVKEEAVENKNVEDKKPEITKTVEKKVEVNKVQEAEAKTEPVKTTVPEKEEVKEEVKYVQTPEVKENKEEKKTSENKKAEKEQKVQEEKKPEAKPRENAERGQGQNNQRPQRQQNFDNRNRGQQRDGQQRNNDRNNNRNNDRRDGQQRNNDRNNNRNNGNDRRFGNNSKNFNKDRNGNGRGDRNNDRNNNRNNDRRDFRRNDRNDAPAEPIQDKNRKSRENKIRQDRQERNKKNYEDGGRKGKNIKRGDFSKPMLEKPKKKEEKKEEIKIIQVPDFITIGELAEKMKMTASTLIKKLFLEGKMVTVNTEIDFDSAEEIALGYEIMCEKEEKVDIIEELLKEDDEDESLMVKRPPVVCVMGHVDHGKTSLLDAIRETNVISGEAGGITQHIGASVVKINDQTITFLDTPGHEAFTSMRMRGAQSTDIAILVVAADDGVMPQTVEAINHAKAAGIEIIVAINKIDKPGANIDRVKQGLAEHELLASDWGGNVEMVPVSAHTREGIDDLLEMVLLQADVLELKANPNRQARGIVIEAKLDKGKGPVATVLVQKGTLKKGAHIAAGANHGKVRAMTDDRGNDIKTAGPSTPVEILGLNGVPNAGEVFVSTETAAEAKEFANTFIEDSKNKLMESNKFRISLDDLNSQIEAGELKELNIIIKADVQGSVEAVKQSLLKLSNDEVEVKIIHSGVGAINESDVILASTSNAIILGFNVKPDSQAEATAKNENVDLRLYSVIYTAIDDIERAMKGMLEPVYEEKVIGHAEIRQIFKASGVGNIAGSYVLDGNMQRGCSARVSRDGKQIYEGPVASLKRFKDDVKEVKAGYECGLVFDGFNDIAEGDQVEAYIMVEVPR
ncbi:translation initiation factor IF-2 [uncultured Eubacterium sp.]|uniref:translation initiation factor IF-2 n=1 Tax=uncultured Eubacterium sp. TaxID=165185 RepID=UPI00267269F9|nr:translation initiation factor IF-2 [uncultured Eubacterium sp.]